MAEVTYSIVEDSHYRRWLKEEGYGFIGLVERVVRQEEDGQQAVSYRVVPKNKGVLMSEDELLAALESADP